MKTCTECKIEKSKADFSRNASRKDGLQSNCKACAAARYADYRAANPERCAARHAKYRAENIEKYTARQAVYQAENREQIAAKGAAYRAANKDRIAASNARYYAANPGKREAISAAYYASNPEKFAAKRRNRRARKRNAEGSHTAADIRAIFDKQQGLCANCQTRLFKSGSKKYHIDHIMPLALGGSNWPANLQCLCPFCNLSKGAKDPIQWAEQNGRLL